MRHLMAALPAAGLLAAFLLAPLPASAADPWDYTERDDGTLEVICTDQSLTRAEVPAEIDGKAVTALGEECFYGCTELTEVVLPESLEKISSYAFQGCISLTEITIPETVGIIEDFGFEGCLALTAIEVDADNESYCSEDGVLYTRNKTNLLRYPAAKPDHEFAVPPEVGVIAPWCFTDCRYLRDVTMENVKAMGADVFMGCTALQTVALSEKIPALIGATFAKCEMLTSVVIPDSVTEIGDRCFFGCASLNDIGTPQKLEKIGEMAFYGCVSLTDITLPGSLKEIGKDGLGYTVDTSGETVKIEGIKLTVPFGSFAYRYAREHSLGYHATVPQNVVMIVLVGFLLAVLAVIGIVVELRRRKAAKLAEEARIAEEKKQAMLAARREAKKARKNKT